MLPILLLGCESTFISDEVGYVCPQTGILASAPLNETNYYQYQYYQVDETSPCQRRRCLEGKWVVATKHDTEIDTEIDTDTYSCNYSCMDHEGDDPDKPYCGECINNDQRCDNNTFQICKKGLWKLAVNCTELGTSCVIINGAPTCGACMNGNEKFYNSQTNVCRRMKCEDAKWILDENSCDQKEVSCNLNTPGCGECLNHDVKCEAYRISQCVDGTWIKVDDCDYSCTQITDEDEHKHFICGECIDGTTRHWNHPDNGICVYSKCENGKWMDDYTQCPNASCILNDNGEFQKCGECLNNNNRCNGQQYQQCKNGTYKTILNCDSCSNNVCVRSCSELNKCTQDTEDIATYCNAEGKIEFCPAGCTSDNLCINCKDGDQVFQADENDICFYKTCQNDLFPKDYTQCMDDHNNVVSCVKDSENKFSCGECKNGNIKCEQATSSCKCQICQNGQWIFLCDNNNVSCKGSSDNYSYCGDCLNGKKSYYMDGSTCYYKECKSGTFGTPIKCSGDNSCKGSLSNYTECGECKNGNIKCEQATSSCKCQICQNGQWIFLCDNNNVSCKGSSDNYSYCGDCLNGKKSYYMDGSTCYYKECKSGTFGTPIKCSGGNSCKGSSSNYTGCGECINGNTYTESSDICQYTQCISGVKDKTIHRCANSFSCKKTSGKYTACGDCRNKTTKCENSRLYTCTDGVWPIEGTICPKGCNSNGSGCKK